MTRNEHLLTVVAEEAGEITQATTKIMRFGLDNYNPFKPEENNEDSLLTEFYQLQGMIEHLQEIGYLKTLSQEEIQKIKDSKILKVYHYMEEAKRAGTIKE